MMIKYPENKRVRQDDETMTFGTSSLVFFKEISREYESVDGRDGSQMMTKKRMMKTLEHCGRLSFQMEVGDVGYSCLCHHPGMPNSAPHLRVGLHVLI